MLCKTWSTEITVALHTPCSHEIFVSWSCYHHEASTSQSPMHDEWPLEKPNLTMINSTYDPIHTHCCLFFSEGENLLLHHPQHNILLHPYTTGVFFIAMVMIWVKKDHNRHNDARWVGDGWFTALSITKNYDSQCFVDVIIIPPFLCHMLPWSFYLYCFFCTYGSLGYVHLSLL